MLIPSANDAGYALAIHTSGSIENFSKLMNEKAKEIGCTGTNFVNPSGIHDENHYSTARDMALIGMYSLKYPEIAAIGNKTSYTLQSNSTYTRTFETTNTLLKPSGNSYYEYATGLKTGFTDPAGSCIIATAKKDNMEFLAVVLGAPEPDSNLNYRDSDCKALFEYGFENYDEITKVEEKDIIKFDDLIAGKRLPEAILEIGTASIGIYIILIIFKSITKQQSKKKQKSGKK